MVKPIGPLIGWGRRDDKTEAREQLLANLPLATSALFMPASECLCIKQALQSNVIDERTYLLTVERDAKVYRNMRRTLRRMKLKNVEMHHTMLHCVPITKPLDFVFLDLCGTVTRNIADWMVDVLSPMLLPNAVVIFAFAEGWRNNQFIPTILSKLKDTDLANEIAGEIGTSDNAVVLDICFLRILLKHWSFKVEFMLRYCDTVQMCAYRLFDFSWLEHPLDVTWDKTPYVAEPSTRVRSDESEHEWKSVDFHDIPDRSRLEVLTMEALKKGITNSDAIREFIRRKYRIKMDERSGGVTWASPTGKFINEHAHVLRDLVMRGIIQPVARKEYTVVG
jgi:hypothetical protein